MRHGEWREREREGIIIYDMPLFHPTQCPLVGLFVANSSEMMSSKLDWGLGPLKLIRVSDQFKKVTYGLHATSWLFMLDE